MPDPNAPFFVSFLTAFVGQSAGYFAVVGFFWFVFWRWGHARFREARTAPKREPFDGQIAYEVRHTLVTLLTGTGNAMAISALYAGGHTRLVADASGYSAASLVGIVLSTIAFNDLWFYASHRLLHHKRLFKYVHAVHHRSIVVTPFSSYSFHFVESAILGGWVLPMAMLVPFPLPVLGALQGIGLANNVMAHLGYELLPRWWVRVPGLRWTNSATFHSMHHTEFRGNYGLFTRLWDRLFGTELPGYEAAFVRRGGDGPAEPHTRA